MGGRKYYTYAAAAKRLGYSVGTIKKWRREGMPTARDAKGRVVIEHSVLLAEYRRRLAADPVRSTAARKRAAQFGFTPASTSAPGLDNAPRNPPKL